ncbi:unnamed protein product [Closterium sp. NIES-65]|nr:unnamed protein product [Closterium sp. NIES-65]
MKRPGEPEWVPLQPPSETDRGKNVGVCVQECTRLLEVRFVSVGLKASVKRPEEPECACWNWVGEQECEYYMRTGSCAYGPRCRFNHPPRLEAMQPLLPSTPYPQRPGQTECKYYLKTGTCKYGPSCTFHHPPLLAATPAHFSPLLANLPFSLSLPSSTSPSVLSQDWHVQYYLKTGTCKYGPSCTFHHPPLLASAPAGSSHLPLNALGYPLRPGETECAFFLRTGRCKFGATCKFHHPDLHTPPLQPIGLHPSQQHPSQLLQAPMGLHPSQLHPSPQLQSPLGQQPSQQHPSYQYPSQLQPSQLQPSQQQQVQVLYPGGANTAEAEEAVKQQASSIVPGEASRKEEAIISADDAAAADAGENPGGMAEGPDAAATSSRRGAGTGAAAAAGRGETLQGHLNQESPESVARESGGETDGKAGGNDCQKQAVSDVAGPEGGEVGVVVTRPAGGERTHGTTNPCSKGVVGEEGAAVREVGEVGEV